MMMAAEPVYLYHAKDGEEYRWFISRGLPFKEDLFKSEPTTSYHPPTKIDDLVLELLTDIGLFFYKVGRFAFKTTLKTMQRKMQLRKNLIRTLKITESIRLISSTRSTTSSVLTR